MTSLPRASLPLVALFAAGGLIVFGYSCATRTQTIGAESDARSASATLSARTDRSNASVSDAGSPSQRSDANAQQVGAPVEQTSAASAPAPKTAPDNVARLKADALGDDPTKRAAAIVALGEAPRALAIPVLQRVLSAGEPQVDRPLALKSLRALALADGDADEGIRNVLRQAIYHGDDDATVQGAQAVLDDVENASN